VKKLIFIFCILALTSSCNSMIQQVSTNPLPNKYEELGESSCKACSFMLLTIIPIRFNSMPSRAYYGAIQQKGGDGLINTSIEESWYYAFIGYVRCTKISGTVIREIQ